MTAYKFEYSTGEMLFIAKHQLTRVINNLMCKTPFSSVGANNQLEYSSRPFSPSF